MRLLAMYLPQYHQVKENDKWWGKGYTEWNAVKNAKSLFRNHRQPRVPLNNNYYDLSDESADTWKWQAELTKEYGIYGFCIYHYWFKTGKQLLEKPMEILLKHPEIDLKYCICWANETWTRTWYGLEQEILMKQEHGNQQEWRTHFEYLLPFFKDPRYIKVNNRPIINIHRCSDIKDLRGMRNLWDKMAVENGFSGVYLVAANTGGELETRYELIEAMYNFEPGYTLNHKTGMMDKIIRNINIFIRTIYNRITQKGLLERIININRIYKNMRKPDVTSDVKVYKGLFPMWDNTPRRSYKGSYYKGASPENFYEQLSYMQNVTEKDEFVYINAWNEWGEGCYLEPDTEYEYNFLEQIKKVKEEC